MARMISSIWSGHRPVMKWDQEQSRSPREMTCSSLMKAFITFSIAATERAPHHLTRYAQELAATFHAFYRDCRVVSSDPADTALTKARLRLAKAAKLVLGRSLRLMGVSTPDRM